MFRPATLTLAALSLAIPGALSAQYAPYPGPAYYPQQGYGYAYPPQAYGPPRGYEASLQSYDQCRRDNGLGGAAIGAAIGGLAGNRIAGSGNRLEGTLIGGGLGAIAGLAIDRAEDDPCYSYLPSQYRAKRYPDVPTGYGPYNATGGRYGGHYPAPGKAGGDLDAGYADYRGQGGYYGYGGAGAGQQQQQQGYGWQAQQQQGGGYYAQSGCACGYGQGYAQGYGYGTGYGYAVPGYWVYGAGASAPQTTVVVTQGSTTTVVTEEVVEYEEAGYESGGGDYYYYEQAPGRQAVKRKTKERAYHTKGK